MLDRFRLEDEEAHLAGEDEEQARRFGWWPKRSGPEQFRRMVADDEEAWRTAGPRRRFATRVAGDLVGGCEARVLGNGLATLSYWTFPHHRGRGYAARSVRLLANWAFAELGVERIELHVEPDNAASLAVARRAGFADTGQIDSEAHRIFERRAT